MTLGAVMEASRNLVPPSAEGVALLHLALRKTSGAMTLQSHTTQPPPAPGAQMRAMARAAFAAELGAASAAIGRMMCNPRSKATGKVAIAPVRANSTWSLPTPPPSTPGLTERAQLRDREPGQARHPRSLAPSWPAAACMGPAAPGQP